MHRRPRVGQQRPRGGRPYDEGFRVPHHRGVGVDEREAHVGRLVLLVVVDARLTQLVAGERRATTGAVGDDLHPLVEEAPVEELLQVPPDRLDVLGAERPVGGVEVHPVPDAGRELGEVVDVGEHGLAAQTRELGDPHLLFDLSLPGDAELLLDLHLHGEPVGVPAGPPCDEVAAHRLEPAEQVLVDACPHVMESRTAVRRGRALVEDPRLGPLALGDRPLEHLVLGPTDELRLFEHDEVGVRGGWAEHGGLRDREGARWRCATLMGARDPRP